MGKYFVLPEDGVGPGGDIIFRRYGANHPNWYRVCVGDESLGMVHKGHAPFLGWIASSHNFNARIRCVEGFRSRMHAATYLIKHRGYWLRDEKEQDKTRQLLQATMNQATKEPRKKPS